MDRGKPPSGFWIGCHVRRKFDSKGWFRGTIDNVETDDGQLYFHVTYTDLDEEEIDLVELYDSAIYHPALDHEGDEKDNLPEVGEFTLYTLQYEPRLGQVVEVRPDQKKAIVVHLWKPQVRVKSFHKARFKAGQHGDERILHAIIPVQIIE